MIIGRYAKYKPVADHEMYVYIDPKAHKVRVVNGTINIAFSSHQLHPGIREKVATLILQIDLSKMVKLLTTALVGNHVQQSDILRNALRIDNDTAYMYNYYQGVKSSYDVFVDEPMLCVYKTLYFFYLISNNAMLRKSFLPPSNLDKKLMSEKKKASMAPGRKSSVFVADIDAASLHILSDNAITILSETLGLPDELDTNWSLVANYQTASLYGMGILKAVAGITDIPVEQVEEVVRAIATVIVDASSNALLSGAMGAVFSLPYLCTFHLFMDAKDKPALAIRPAPGLKAGVRTSTARWFQDYWKVLEDIDRVEDEEEEEEEASVNENKKRK